MTAPRRWPALRPWLLVLGVWCLLAGVTATALWHARREAVDSQARELSLLSVALNDGIARGLLGVEEGLRTLGSELREGGTPLQGADVRAALRTRAGLMPLVDTLWLLKQDGQVLAASDDGPPPALESFKPALQDLAPALPALSRAFEGGRAHEPMLALALSFEGRREARAGWIVAAMPASSLLGAFGSALHATEARLGLFRADGARLIGVNLLPVRDDDEAVARRLARQPGIEVRRFRDGSDNLVALQTVPGHELKLLLTRDLDTALSAWREAAGLAAAALGVLLLVMGAALVFVQRADRRGALAQRALQQQAARSGKLESLGTLAGGVAHDFNNVLAGIVGFGEMAQDAADPGSKQARHLDKLLQAAQRGQALVERILAFSRGGARASTVFELDAVVEEVLTLLSASLRAGVVLERVLDAPGACVRGDPTQVFEAVMNLCTNGLQAMPQGGMLSVRLQRLQVDQARVLSHSRLAPGRYLALAVADQGSGITADVMEHLFEPFFTTRAAESGTGLGLAVVFGVVAEVGGAIDVSSPAGQGACFTLYLPECLEQVNQNAGTAEEPRRGQGQRVLVVDDQPELLALMVELLTSLGYTPVAHSDPQAALQLLLDGTQDFAALVTDEVMPGLTGTGLTRALRQQRPHAPQLPVLMVSGYGGASLAQRASEAGVDRLLSKPVRRAQLAQALADLLD